MKAKTPVANTGFLIKKYAAPAIARPNTIFEVVGGKWDVILSTLPFTEEILEKKLLPAFLFGVSMTVSICYDKYKGKGYASGRKPSLNRYYSLWFHCVMRFLFKLRKLIRCSFSSPVIKKQLPE
jgi:hypothetical protein